MKIIFLGAARTVTGSCYMLEHAGSRFLVDCGMFQGSKALKERNYMDFPFSPADLDFVLLTHAHIDHSGLLPKLYKHGFKGQIFATPGTVDLCAIMLPDCGYIQEMEVERKNRKLSRAGQPLITPIYTAGDALSMQGLFESRDYGQTFSPAPGISVTFRDAGHILGSAFADIRYRESGGTQKLLFTGDLGRYVEGDIVNDPTDIAEADYVIMESTYGNRLHKGTAATNAPILAEIINETLAKSGNVVIPAFAVDRTQDILMMLNLMQEDGRIGRNSIYVDSPLAVKATEIFAKYPQYFDEVTAACYREEGRVPFILPNLIYVRRAEDSVRLNAINGSIIISASGMADAGRIKHHLKHNLWREDSTVIFIGYQAEGTLGRRLIDGEKKVTIHGEQIEVKARIVNLDGFSAHADRDEMLEWLSRFTTPPKKIFITHGEENSALEFAELVREKTGVDTETPQMGDIFELLATEAPLVAQDQDLAQLLLDENVLAEINTTLQTLAITRDYEKLLRVRDFLRQVS